MALALLAGASVLGAPVSAQDVEAYELRALFLYNFTKFVTWPGDAFEDDEAPFRICVVGGDSRLWEFLDGLVAGERAGGRPLVVRRSERIRETEGCQIVYVPAGHDPGHLPSVLGARRDTVLTVGEGEGFLDAGGVLQFYPDNQKIRLRINESERERLRLRMSSRLIQLCDRVRPQGSGPAGATAARR